MAPVVVSGATRLAGVIGWPVRHSLSPTIHNAGFVALGLDWTYVAFPVPPGQALRAIDGMRGLGIDGLSVTMPHKRAVAALVDRTTADATALGVVNCVFRDGEDLVGDNTDGKGLVASLAADEGIDVAGMRCVVLGAGGAARSVIRSLSLAGAADIVVVNRTESKGADAASYAPAVGRVGDLTDVAGADLVVQSTSVGMGNDGRSLLSADDLRSDQVIVDLVYHPAVTPLLGIAEGLGARTIGGIGMLVHQAAAQFTNWTGCEAPLSVMRDAADRVIGTR